MKTPLLALAVVAVPQLALAQPAPDEVVFDPAAAPGFVTMDRQSSTSEVGGELSYLSYDTGNSGTSITPIRFDLYGSFVDPIRRLGGYAQLPISYVGTDKDSYTGVGNVEVGGIFAPRLTSPGFGLVLHGGVTLPTASTGNNDSAANLVDSIGRITDFYLIIPKGFSVRLGGSGIWRTGQLFARADLGVDINLSQQAKDTVDAFIRANFGVGVDLGTAMLAVELTNLYTTGKTNSDTFGAAWIDTGALTARFRAGTTTPYVAVGFPLEHDSRYFFLDKYNAAITAGVSALIR